MSIVVRRAAAAVAVSGVIALSATACSSGSSGSSGTEEKAAGTSGAPPGGIPVGPGPRSPYTVQKQPEPGSCHYRYTSAKEPLPDPKCSPGATNPKVTQDTIKSTICCSGYTSDIRPSTNITSREKTANAASYGYKGNLRDAEYDHLISLQLGGDPNDPRNLWVQPPSPGHKPGAGPNNPKDVVENKLKAAICAGKTQLAKAQQAIARDWTTALSVLGIQATGTPRETSDADDG
ncbi:hypothetical protein AB0K09_09650 [Streptomyces sp. NPDC049577]|uniref:hypothetical protein n=1 Tax=Streptomyces sp. NPDC049577 TaxID=3155153 RepID=UPI0034260288